LSLDKSIVLLEAQPNKQKTCTFKILVAFSLILCEHKKNNPSEGAMRHEFGGDWTEEKLAVMRHYFTSYATALQNKPTPFAPFVRLYVDAFAGTGQRTEFNDRSKNQTSIFGKDENDVEVVKDGSVRIALKIDPPFNRYIFNDKSSARAAELEVLKSEFSTRTIEVRQGDANQFLVDVARNTDWRSHRAAVFIDPYGMQVKWATLEALANTKAIDLALLFPTGGLSRMLTVDGDIPNEWASRIDDHLGPCNWRNAVYRETEEPSLFTPKTPKTEKHLTVEGLRQFVQNRLTEIFPFVAEKQLELRNSKNAVLYHLFIICANPSPLAQALAKKLAEGAIRAARRSK
jgi:three-Cys-motif partner protein